MAGVKNLGIIVVSNSYEVSTLNGQNLRVRTLIRLLEPLVSEIKIIRKTEATRTILKSGRIVVICSFSAIPLLKLKLMKNPNIWFDPYDSWFLNRLNVPKKNIPLNIFKYIRDIFKIYNLPRLSLITFISKRDLEHHRNYRNSTAKLVLPNYLPNLEFNYEETVRIVFVGDGNYLPNQEAVKVLSNIGRAINRNIHIIGRGYKTQLPNLVYLGFLTESNFYSKWDIYLAPINYGSGIQNKIAIPLSLGLEVITTSFGAKAFKEIENLQVASTVEDYARCIDTALKRIQNKSIEFIGNGIYKDDETSVVESRIREILQ